MRPLAALCIACFLAGCGSGRSPLGQPQAASPAPAHDSRTRQAPIEPDVQLLLAASAKDFHAHQPPYPARFRGVRSGHIADPDGKKRYLLSGQFLPKPGQVEPEWTPFATIKTSDYEQLLGSQAESYSRQPSIVWDDRGDLSPTLQSRLDSLR